MRERGKEERGKEGEKDLEIEKRKKEGKREREREREREEEKREREKNPKIIPIYKWSFIKKFYVLIMKS